MYIIFSQSSLIYGMASFVSPTLGDYEYPRSALIIGWVIAVIPVVPVPLFFIFGLAKAKGTILQVKLFFHQCVK